MRYALPLVCLAVACGSENELRYTSTLDAQTYGVRLSADGLEAHAAMAGTTCTIDPEWGCPVADADLPTAEEVIVDHHAGVTLGRSPRGLHRLSRDGWQRAADIAEPLVRTARLTDRGTAILAGTEDGCWLQRDQGDHVAVDGAACAEDVPVTVDRDQGTLYAGTRSGVLAIDDEGSHRLGRFKGDLVSWDRKGKRLYVAEKGTNLVLAINRKGEELWRWESGGLVQSLASRGGKGQVMVLSRLDSGLGVVNRLDGETGHDLGESEIPVTDADVEVSDDGDTIAIVADAEVHFYVIEDGEDDNKQTELRDAPTCIQPDRTLVD